MKYSQICVDGFDATARNFSTKPNADEIKRFQ